MEVFCQGLLILLWWFASLTLLFPLVLLLLFSKFVRYHWYAWLFRSGNVITEKFASYRSQLFGLLDEHLKARTATSEALQVLEIGIGQGANLELYPEGIILTSIDVNPYQENFLEAKKRENPHITYGRTFRCKPENMEGILHDSMDIVVATYLLCSVEDATAVLNEVKRVLKPGGKYLFLEHVSYPREKWSYTVQKMAAPLWTLYCNGCCITRNPEPKIRAMMFRDLVLENDCPPEIWFLLRPQIWGIATK